ncbi:GntR family transcriptional regulator [Bosea psychrotolerans]|uniref:DNA-binding GntR family transcriptional regulator n=1 Tax=Bosea psychrotolerans TaxID=1871628 RepID=A0A2S4MB26_9HYPH|nr:GntR family transcriptional regulator [Bosea psychrotolerans]POR51946.1 DNA-binding GntR family transcriptional regulator [Bosea psychrotolerans]
MAEAVERVYVAIRSGIIDGTYPSGTPLRAEGLAIQLGVSRTPVREAFRRLDAEGLVRIVANQGARVTGWSRRAMEEVFGIRVRLESYAAELGATTLSEEAIDELDQLDVQMRNLAAGKATGFIDAIATANSRFHRIIVDGSMNQRLAAMISMVVETHLIGMTFRNYGPGDLARSMSHHSELVSAFRARNGAWASAVMQSHILAARSVVIADSDET